MLLIFYSPVKNKFFLLNKEIIDYEIAANFNKYLMSIRCVLVGEL